MIQGLIEIVYILENKLEKELTQTLENLRPHIPVCSKQLNKCKNGKKIYKCAIYLYNNIEDIQQRVDKKIYHPLEKFLILYWEIVDNKILKYLLQNENITHREQLRFLKKDYIDNTIKQTITNKLHLIVTQPLRIWNHLCHIQDTYGKESIVKEYISEDTLQKIFYSKKVNVNRMIKLGQIFDIPFFIKMYSRFKNKNWLYEPEYKNLIINIINVKKHNDLNAIDHIIKKLKNYNSTKQLTNLLSGYGTFESSSNSIYLKCLLTQHDISIKFNMDPYHIFPDQLKSKYTKFTHNICNNQQVEINSNIKLKNYNSVKELNLLLKHHFLNNTNKSEALKKLNNLK